MIVTIIRVYDNGQSSDNGQCQINFAICPFNHIYDWIYNRLKDYQTTCKETCGHSSYKLERGDEYMMRDKITTTVNM